ncbi:MAG TPA: hypothetical protein VF881_00095 [Polyangiaceae bacterium]
MRTFAVAAGVAVVLNQRPVWAADPPSAAVVPPPGVSQADDPEKATIAAVAATRRSGFTAGFLGGMAFGTVEGYPNDFSQIDNPLYRSATSGVGGTGMLYIGGALTDWFTFGLGFARTSYGSSRIVTNAGVFLFHIETFPLFAQGGLWRDAGLFANFGTGTATIRRRSDEVEFSSSGSLSVVGLGAFWEPLRAGHFAAGPFASWQYQVSDSMTRHFGEIGLRGVFYGGP